MSDIKSKHITPTLLRGKFARLPQVIVEENDLGKGKQVEVHYGTNYCCAVILPIGVKLGEIQKERISKLLNEPLETQR